MKNTAVLYKYMSTRFLEDVLSNSRLYLDDGTHFNDPFEISAIERKSGCLQYVKGLHILCLCNSYQKKLMWSHYADSHKGVCLAVRVPVDDVYPVSYTSKRLYTDSNIDAILAQRKNHVKTNLDRPCSLLKDDKKKAYVKDSKWSYEHEYRIVLDNTDEDKMSAEGENMYYPVTIERVYVGVRFDEQNVISTENLIRICKKMGIEVKKMKLGLETYGLSPVPIDMF